MPNMFGGDQLDDDYAPYRRVVKPNMVHVNVENVKVKLNESSVEVVGEYHLYNDAGKEVEKSLVAHLMKLNFTEDKESGTVCFSLTKEALIDIISKVNKYPHVYSFDRNAQ